MDQTLLRYKTKKKKKSKRSKQQPVVENVLPKIPDTSIQEYTLSDLKRDVDTDVPPPVVINKISEAVPRVMEGPTEVPEEEAEVDGEDMELDEPATETEPVIQAEPAPLAAAAAAAALSVLESDDEDEDEDEDEAPDVLTKEDVLEATKAVTSAVAPTQRTGGELGAAFSELKSNLHLRMANRMHQYFQALYDSVKGNEKKFNKALARILMWDQAAINRRAREILAAYPDTENYFRYAYAANVMLMSVVVKQDREAEDIDVDVPKFSVFIKNAYVHAARVYYNTPGILSKDIPAKHRLSILRELNQAYMVSITSALQVMVPLDKIAPAKGESAPSENYDEFAELKDDEESGEESESDSEEEESGSEDESEEEESDSDEDDDEESGSEEESESDSDDQSTY